MNIRGTDAKALAAVTDLFAAVAPSRDPMGDDFHRALQATPTSSSRQDSSSDAPPAASAPAEQAKPHDDEDRKDSAPESTTAEPTAAATTGKEGEEKQAELIPDAPAISKTQAEDGLTDEERKARDLAAESMIAVSNMHSTRQMTPPTEQKVLAEGTEIADGEETEAAKAVEAIAEVETQPIALGGQIEVNSAATEQAAPIEEIVAAEQAVAEVVTEATTSDSDSKGNSGGIGVLPSAVTQEQKPARSDDKKTTSNATAGKIPITGEIASEATTDEAVQATAQPEETKTRKRSEKRDDADASVQALPVHQADPGLSVAAPDLGNAITQPATGEELTAATPPTVNSAGDAAARAPDQAGLNINPAASVATNNIASRLPAHALVRNTGANSEGAPVHIDAARFLQRVAKAFESAKERGGEIRLRLSPPELGALRVEVTMHNEGLVARVEAETPEAQAVLLEHLPVLRERLAEQGMKLERFDVDLSQRQPDGQQSQGEMYDRSNQRQPGQTSPVPRPHIQQREPASERSAAAAPATTWQDRQLNVIV